MKFATWLVVVLDLLATYRLTRLVVEDSFPPILWLRERIVRRFTTVTITGAGSIEDPRAIAELVQCPWCASMWVAGGVVLLNVLFPGAWPWVALIFAGSAAAGIISQLVDD